MDLRVVKVNPIRKNGEMTAVVLDLITGQSIYRNLKQFSNDLSGSFLSFESQPMHTQIDMSDLIGSQISDKNITFMSKGDNFEADEAYVKALDGKKKLVVINEAGDTKEQVVKAGNLVQVTSERGFCKVNGFLNINLDNSIKLICKSASNYGKNARMSSLNDEPFTTEK